MMKDMLLQMWYPCFWSISVIECAKKIVSEIIRFMKLLEHIKHDKRGLKRWIRDEESCNLTVKLYPVERIF